MAQSFRCRLKKLSHDGKIDAEELDVLIRKLEGHDKKIRADAINECIKFIKAHSEKHFVDCDTYSADLSEQENVFIVSDWLNELEQLKEQKNE